MSKVFANMKNIQEFLKLGTPIPTIQCGTCDKVHEKANEDTIIDANGFYWLQCECDSTAFYATEKQMEASI